MPRDERAELVIEINKDLRQRKLDGVTDAQIDAIVNSVLRKCAAIAEGSKPIACTPVAMQKLLPLSQMCFLISNRIYRLVK